MQTNSSAYSFKDADLGRVEDKDSEDEEDLKSVDNSTPYYNSDTPLQDKDSPSDKSRIAPQKAASPMVIQWLQDNYEAAEGTSLPRSTLYTHYISYCSSTVIEPVNAASFGKLIRSIFPNLKTRRLGTRGHSKYHYYGIRIKANSDLRLPSFSSTSMSIGMNNANMNSGGTVNAKLKPRIRDFESSSDKMMLNRIESEQSGLYDIGTLPSNFTLGATNVQLPDFSLPETLNLSGEFSMDMAHTFMTSYRAHCQALVDSTFKHHFMDVDKLLHHFWQSLPAQYRVLVSTPDVVDLIIEKDQLTYKAIATVLLPNVLQSLPVSIPQSIRQFAKQLESWLASSLDGLPQYLVAKKMNVVKKFSQSLHKQASLNHLTQAARAVLQNTSQVSQMIIDWNRLDFEFIKDQATWICQCSEDFIQSAQDDFKRFMTERATLEQWAQWLQEIVHKIIGKTGDARELVLLSQQLLLKWSFYSTLIIRDLTIRNASSFGSFHLLRTLFDEYIFYLVETKFASLVHHQYPQQQQQHHQNSASSSSTPNPNITTPTMIPTSNMPIHVHPYDSTIETGYSHHNQHHNQNLDSYSLDVLLNKDSSRNKHLPSPFDAHSNSNTNTPNQHHQHHVESDQDYGMMHQDLNSMLHLQNYGGYPQQQPGRYAEIPENLKRGSESLKPQQQVVYGHLPTTPGNENMRNSGGGYISTPYDNLLTSNANSSPLHYGGENISGNINGNKKLRMDMNEVK